MLESDQRDRAHTINAADRQVFHCEGEWPILSGQLLYKNQGCLKHGKYLLTKLY